MSVTVAGQEGRETAAKCVGEERRTQERRTLKGESGAGVGYVMLDDFSNDTRTHGRRRRAREGAYCYRECGGFKLAMIAQTYPVQAPKVCGKDLGKW